MSSLLNYHKAMWKKFQWASKGPWNTSLNDPYVWKVTSHTERGTLILKRDNFANVKFMSIVSHT